MGMFSEAWDNHAPIQNTAPAKLVFKTGSDQVLAEFGKEIQRSNLGSLVDRCLDLDITLKVGYPVVRATDGKDVFCEAAKDFLSVTVGNGVSQFEIRLV